MGNTAFLIGAAASGVGKTSAALSIMSALKKEYSVRAFKAGPDYIDPAFHKHLLGKSSTNLDSFLQSKDTIKRLFYSKSKGSDVSIVEGVMGLYDGLGGMYSEGSSADLAKTLGIGVLLVMDAGKRSASAAAEVLGMKAMDPGIDIRGVVINNIKSLRHYDMLKYAVENYAKTPVLGYIKKDESIKIPSRHLGLFQSHEIDELDDMLERMGSAAKESIELDKLIKLFHNGNRCCEVPEIAIKKPNNENLKIAVAEDKAFSFIYDTNIENLENQGAQIVKLSPCSDDCIPDDIDALYLPGGYPELYADELGSNTAFISSMKNKLDLGLPCFAECGGLMYLAKSIKMLDGSKKGMSGYLDVGIEMTKSLKRFGYVKVSLKDDCLIGERGSSFRAHEFHHSMMRFSGENDLCYNVEKASDPQRKWQCGYIKNNLCAGYAHFNFAGENKIAEHIAGKAKYHKRIKQ